MGTRNDRTWYVEITQVGRHAPTARFGHRKAGAGWVWDEVTWGELPTPLTEAVILSEIYAAVLEFLERHIPQ